MMAVTHERIGNLSALGRFASRDYCKSMGERMRQTDLSRSEGGSLAWNGVFFVKLGVLLMVVAGIFGIFGCAAPQRDLGRAVPPMVSTVLELEGDWVDLEAAVATAASDAGLAVVGVDRWRTMVMFELVTDGGQAGELVVMGIRAGDEDEGEDVEGIARGEARIGRFRDGNREGLLLSSLRDELVRLRGRQHLPPLDEVVVEDGGH